MKTINVLVLAAVVALSACKPHQETPAPSVNHALYPEPEQAPADLAAALKTAAATHKRILVDFGGNWCGDCQVLDIYLHAPANEAILEQNFVLVHVNIGHMDANQEIAGRYAVPLDKGVPAMAVLNEKGELLYSQRGGEFESMRRMDPATVTSFLVQWEPQQAGCSAAKVNC